MGCFQSKKTCHNIHSNVFKVWNIDDDGAQLWSGTLVISEHELSLFRHETQSLKWPLGALRRYGFDGDIFSFESGRRCDTGEGIFAFRCPRASVLFQKLQNNIQQRNNLTPSTNHCQLPTVLACSSPSMRQTLQANVTHRSSIDNGQPSTNIETPQPQTSQSTHSLASDYKLGKRKENNNNQNAETRTPDSKPPYTNEFARDLAVLRSTLMKETALKALKEMEEERLWVEKYGNDGTTTKTMPISPSLSTASDQYSQPTTEQYIPANEPASEDKSRLYMNILRGNPFEEGTNNCDTAPTTPLTPKPPDSLSFSSSKPEMNAYANLALVEPSEHSHIKPLNLNSSSAEITQKFSESDTFTSMSPIEEMEVNYAVLDIDGNKETSKPLLKELKEKSSPEHSCASSRQASTTSQCSTQINDRNLSLTSLENMSPSMVIACIGYTTIDFDKTVALTSVAAETDIDVAGTRKTRHNSVHTTSGSPSSSERAKLN